MDKHAYDLFITIGRCHRLLKEHAAELRLRSDVMGVTHWFDIFDVGDACRLEEYVSAELDNGQGVSWCFELTLAADGITVEADVRRNDRDGEDVLAEIAACEYRDVRDVANNLLEITRKLCASNPI